MSESHGTAQSRPRTRGETCGAKTRGGGTCGSPAGWGTDHVGYGCCKLHGGSLPSHRLAAARQEVVAQTGRFMGTPIDLDPATAILLCVQVAAGHVEYATRQVAEVPEDEAFIDTALGKQLHPWARVQQEALDRLSRYSKLAIDAGAEERDVRLAEKWGSEIASILQAVLDDLDLTEDQIGRVPDVLDRVLLPLEHRPMRLGTDADD